MKTPFKVTYYLGMEYQYIAHAVNLWHESGLKGIWHMYASAKTEGLVILEMTTEKNDFETASLINKIWNQTRCRLTSNEREQ